MLDAACAPRLSVPAEVTVVGGGLRSRPGLVVHRDTLLSDEITEVGEVRCTSPLRTAFDLARGPNRDDAVVAVDRLANRHRFAPDRVEELCARHPGRRGVARIQGVLALATPYAGSPMETRIRLLIVAAGLPCPEVQWVVQDVGARTAIWLDLAWPELMIGIEYEVGRTPSRAGCCATSAGTPALSTAAGRSTATPSSTCTASATGSSRS
jgi:hypothetical protein